MGRVSLLLPAALLLGLGAAVVLTAPPPPPGALLLQASFGRNLSGALDLVGYSEVNVTTSPFGIHLTAECRRLTLAALPAQTQSVASGLGGRVEIRPNAHDLLREVLGSFNITFLQARVERLAGDTYYGRLNLQQGSTILSLDSRPSDAIALAVRMNGTVYVNQSVLERAGERVC